MAGRRLLPRARRQNLIVRQVAGETLVYDESCHKAHCLNNAASLVWECCDGRTSPAAAARRLQERVDAAMDERAVSLAVRQLEKAHLLEAGPVAREGTTRLSRREVARKLGIAALALPLVSSILAPTAAQAATCVPCGQSCNIITDTCCAPCICTGVLGCQ